MKQERIKQIIRLEQRAVNIFENKILPIKMNNNTINLQRYYIDLIRSKDYLDKYLKEQNENK